MPLLPLIGLSADSRLRESFKGEQHPMRHPTLHHRLLTVTALAALGVVACSAMVGRVQTAVTGHINYPSQAVRAVFERLDTEPALLDRTSPSSELHRPPTAIGPTAPEPTMASGCPSVPKWWPVGAACAQEIRRPSLPADPEQALIDELRLIPEVSEAMGSRRERERLIREWMKADLIGEANDGRLIFLKGRRDVDREALAQIANENDDRLILIRAMAHAVVSINGVEPTERLIAGQLQATRRSFTAARRRLSPAGAWIQLPDGQWVKK
jgi:hypothetical protein